LGGAPKPWGSLNRARPNCVKFYDLPVRTSFAAAKTRELRAEVVGGTIRRLWLMTGYFTDSVSWVTDLTPYLPQDVAGYYEEKMTQVSAVKSPRLITLDDCKCAQ
jgi:hypothetical protein